MGKAVLQRARGLLKAYRAHYAALLAKYEGIEESIAAQRATRREKTYWGATLAYGEAVTRAVIEWCDATDRKLQKLES